MNIVPRKKPRLVLNPVPAKSAPAEIITLDVAIERATGIAFTHDDRMHQLEARLARTKHESDEFTRKVADGEEVDGNKEEQIRKYQLDLKMYTQQIARIKAQKLKSEEKSKKQQETTDSLGHELNTMKENRKVKEFGETSSGRTSSDGLDKSKTGMRDLRSGLTVIPQNERALFTGTQLEEMANRIEDKNSPPKCRKN